MATSVGAAPRFARHDRVGVRYTGPPVVAYPASVSAPAGAPAGRGAPVATSVHAVIAQRLVRLTCESCAVDDKPEGHEARWLISLLGAQWKEQRYKRGKGCIHCNGIGYHGRTGVYEMLEMTPDLVRAANIADPNKFLEAARPHLKGRTLTDRALQLVFAGRTTVTEAMKVAVQLED